MKLSYDGSSHSSLWGYPPPSNNGDDWGKYICPLWQIFYQIIIYKDLHVNLHDTRTQPNIRIYSFEGNGPIIEVNLDLKLNFLFCHPNLMTSSTMSKFFYVSLGLPQIFAISFRMVFPTSCIFIFIFCNIERANQCHSSNSDKSIWHYFYSKDYYHLKKYSILFTHV